MTAWTFLFFACISFHANTFIVYIIILLLTPPDRPDVYFKHNDVVPPSRPDVYVNFDDLVPPTHSLCKATTPPPPL